MNKKMYDVKIVNTIIFSMDDKANSPEADRIAQAFSDLLADGYEIVHAIPMVNEKIGIISYVLRKKLVNGKS